MKKIIIAILVSLLTLPQLAYGWGQEGHRIIATVAEDHLDQTTLVMIQSLIGNNHLYSVATWADDIRKERRESAPWHYVDIPLGSSYVASRDCAPPRSCVVEKIAEYMRVLTDKSASREERTEALKFIVHFVGDIHQPLHAVGHARGGNNIQVRFFGGSYCGRYECNLHGVWDTSMIQHTRLNRQEYAERLEELIRRDNLSWVEAGTPERWANEAAHLAQAAWVPDSTNLDERYVERQIPVVDRQMALAGLRLASLLNETIGRMTPRDFSAFAAPIPASERRAAGSRVKVWVNTRSGVHHCPGARDYGTTRIGEYMTQREAQEKGYYPAHGEVCR
jgi:nuclease S1